MSELTRVLGIEPDGWERARDGEPAMAAVVAVGGWLVMAWNRFGAQGLAAPRVGVRFVLIGLYAWLALALAIWLLDRLGSGDDRGAPSEELRRLVLVTGLAHRPLVVVAVLLQVISFFTAASGVGLTIAVAGIGLWMPAMLFGAVGWVRPDSTPLRRTALVAVPFLAWLATAGVFLFNQVRHLL